MKDDGKGRDEALERRRFLKGLGLAAGGAAGAAAVAVGVEGRAEEGGPAAGRGETDDEQVRQRYRESPEVKRFYALNRL